MDKPRDTRDNRTVFVSVIKSKTNAETMQCPASKACLLLVAAGGALALVEEAAHAHHSFATHYDASKAEQITGVVTRWDFRSPHSFIYMDVAAPDGGVTPYEVELHSVPVLTRMGYSASVFKPGDRITVNAWPNRSPTNPLVFGIGVITADGVSLGQFPPIRDVESAFLTAPGAQRVQGRWRVPQPPEPTSFERPMSLTPAGLAAVASYDSQRSPANVCEPYNVPVAFLVPYQFDIRIDNREAVIRQEAYNVTRRIPLGPDWARVEPTGVFGKARARIEGNELVIESGSYPASGWGLAAAVDENGLGADIPSSAQKTVIERFSVSDDGLTLTVRYTVDDPVYLTMPYTGTATLDRVADDSPIYEFECEVDSAERFSRDP